MYGAAGKKRPIFVESDDFLYNLGDPTICIGLSKGFCYLFLANTIYAISCQLWLTTALYVVSAKLVKKHDRVVGDRSLFLLLLHTPYIKIDRLTTNRSVFHRLSRPYYMCITVIHNVSSGGWEHVYYRHSQCFVWLFVVCVLHRVHDVHLIRNNSSYRIIYNNTTGWYYYMWACRDHILK